MMENMFKLDAMNGLHGGDDRLGMREDNRKNKARYTASTCCRWWAGADLRVFTLSYSLIMDGPMDGQTDGWMDGWTDGQMDIRAIGWTDGWTDARTDGWMDGRTDKASYRVACPQLKNKKYVEDRTSTVFMFPKCAKCCLMG